MTESIAASENRQGLLDTTTRFTWETISWIILLIGALALRVYELGHRVMSHDESLHTYYSWKLYDHGEYVHDPMMHGPLLFHGTAAMYWIFGDNDFAARMFSVLLGMLLVASPLLLRRWLGPVGALLAGLMLTISPNILYYTRYIRHDIHVELFTVLMFVGFIRYLQDRRGRWIILAFSAAALAISSAEMAYINGFVLVSFIVLALLVERLRPAFTERLSLLLGGVGLGLLVFGYLAVKGLLNAWFPGLPDFTQAPFKEIEQAGILFGGLLMIYAGITSLLAPLRIPPEEDPEFDDDATAGAELPADGFDADDLVEDLDAAEDHLQADDEGEALQPVGRPARASRRSSRLSDLLFGRSSGWLTLGGLVLLALGAWRFQVGACLSDAPMQDLLLGMQACKLAAGLLAAGGVIAVYGLLGWLLQDAEERGLAQAIARAPVESLVLAVVLAFAIYTLLYTTFFTNTPGFNGLVRSIQYWIEQHGVVRGDQPFYYYALLNPLYEFLPFSFALAAAVVYLRRPALRVWRGSGGELGSEPTLASAYFLPGLLAWAAGVFWIYSWAGEKMPWLVTHLVVPQIFLAARLLADTIEVIDWAALRDKVWSLAGLWLLVFVLAAVQTERMLYSDAGWPLLVLILTLGIAAWILWRARALWETGRQTELVFFVALIILLLLFGQWAGGLFNGIWAAIRSLPTAIAGLGGPGLAQGILGLALLAAAIWGLLRVAGDLPRFHLRLLGATVLAALLLVTNVFVSLRANFVNDELATEYMVYAHATDEGNVVLERLEALDEATPDRDLVVGYDNEVSWPYTWYFRTSQWPGARYLGEKPSGTAQLRELDVVLVGSPNYGNFEDYLLSDFNGYEYDRMWWPNEGYKGYSLDRESLRRLVDTLETPETRRNILDIVVRREYRQDPNLPAGGDNEKSLDNWFHHAKMKMWVRKTIDDGAAGVASGPQDAPPTATPVTADLLELEVEARLDRGTAGQPILAPKGIALDAESRLYAIDHENARVQIFDAEGEPAGTLADGELRDDSGAPSAWGVGVSADGSTVYIADTWNHRVLKYVDGELETEWGEFGQPPAPDQALELMYGPRDIAVDADGLVYVADTGNKRISIFEPDGRPVGGFGGGGLAVGNFDEPSSVAIDPETGDIYVADLWNMRVQVFDASRNPIRQWAVDGWTSLDAQHKAYIAVHPAGFVIFSDPEKSRVWLYSRQGEPLGLMSLPTDDVGLQMPIGVAFGSDGQIYVASSGGNMVTRYAPPPVIAEALGAGGDGGDEAEVDDAEGTDEVDAEGSDADAPEDAAGDEAGEDATGEDDASPEPSEDEEAGGTADDSAEDEAAGSENPDGGAEDSGADDSGG